MKNDRGFTLIELIIVIAILGVLLGVASYSIGYVSTTKAKNFSTKLSALISQCRVDTLSGSPADTYLEVTLEDDGYYGTLYEGKNGDDPVVKSREKLGPKNLSCTYIDAVTEKTVDDTDNNNIKVSFTRATGAFSSTVTQIDVATGAGGYTISLVRTTGYHTVARQGGA